MSRPVLVSTTKVSANPALIKAVQTCRRSVDGLGEDEAWRDFLERETGIRSLRQMSVSQLGRVLDALHKAGAPRRHPAAEGRPIAGDDQDRKIRALWIGLFEAGATQDRSEGALQAFVKRQTGMDDLRFLDVTQKSSVTEALKAWSRRHHQRQRKAAGR